MLKEDLIKLVAEIQDKKCELQNVELKKAAKGVPQRLYGTLSAFANQSGGGIIIFGIDENSEFRVCGAYDVQDLQKQVTEQANQMEPKLRPLFTVAKIGGKTVVSAEISECNVFEKPCYYIGKGRSKGSFIRVGEADMPMTEYEVYSYEAFKRKIEDDIRIIERAEKDDLNDDSLSLFLSKLRVKKSSFVNLDNERTYKLCGVLRDNKVTLCGLILFGLFPQASFPQLCITAVVIPGQSVGNVGPSLERFSDNKKIEGTIPEMLDEAIAFVRRNMKEKTIINGQGKRADET
ncbi:MAG: AlbA family DNA-binding domain-containing protein, partial [Anaerovoracaceae bacterium]